MISRQGGSPGAAARTYWPVNLQRFFRPLLVALLLGMCPALAESPDDQYLRIYDIIEQADALATKGDAGQALAKYRQAQVALQAFQKGNPSWNAKLVAYRFTYLAQKVADLSAPPAAPTPTGPAAAKPTAPAATGAPAAKPAAQPQAKLSAANSGIEVKLLEPGAEPRKELRLHPKPGQKQSTTLTMKTAVDTTIGELPSQLVKVPPIQMTSDITVRSVSDEGDISYDILIREASIADESGALPQVVAPVKSALAGIHGLAGAGAITSRGIPKKLEVNLPATADVQTRQVLDQLKDALASVAVPLPKEAIGPGAKWEIKLPITSEGVTVSQTTTYQLASIEGDRPVIKSTVTQGASNQKIQKAAMPGLKLNLTKLVGTGTSTTTSDLAQLLPLQKASELHMDQSATMDLGGQPQAMTTKTDTDLHFEAK